MAGLCAQQYPFLPVTGSPKIPKILFEDSSGRLWVGGPQLAFFDGTRFFYLRDYGFPLVEAYDFSEDPSGAIWIGAETGVYRFANGKLEEIGKGTAVSVIAAAATLAIAAMGPLGQGLPFQATLFRIQRTGAKWNLEARHEPGCSRAVDARSHPGCSSIPGRARRGASYGWMTLCIAEVGSSTGNSPSLAAHAG